VSIRLRLLAGFVLVVNLRIIVVMVSLRLEKCLEMIMKPIREQKGYYYGGSSDL
jgi:hypothetical protein